MEVIEDEAVAEARLFRKDEITVPICPRAERALPTDSENELPSDLERELREALDLSDEGSSESLCCERYVAETTRSQQPGTEIAAPLQICARAQRVAQICSAVMILAEVVCS